MNIKIVLAKPSDMPNIRKVTRNSWLDIYPNESEGITRQDIESKFLLDDKPEGKILATERLKSFFKPNAHTWVAKDNDLIVGYCVAIKEITFNRIQAIYLLSQYHRIGIGNMLIKKAYQWFNNNKETHINVANYNYKAIKFYQHLGFRRSNRKDKEVIHFLPTGAKIQEIEMIKR